MRLPCVSERRACRVLGQPRSTQRHAPRVADDEQRLTGRIVALAGKYGRYGYRRITALLHREGWRVNHKRVERIWRWEGLKVPQRQPKRGRLWLNDGSCIRLRPQHKDHVWAYDFVFTRTHDGRPVRMLTMVDEYTRECLAIDVGRSPQRPQYREPSRSGSALRFTPGPFCRWNSGRPRTYRGVVRCALERAMGRAAGALKSGCAFSRGAPAPVPAADRPRDPYCAEPTPRASHRGRTR